MDADWSINAAGQKYFDLINEWTTTDSGTSDAAGEVGFRGFHGEYIVTTTHPTTGVKNYHCVNVLPGDGDLEVDLVLDTSPDTLTIYGTDGDDVFEYDLSDVSKVFVNGQPMSLSLPVDLTKVCFEGLGGTDHLEVKTKVANGRARISDRELTWLNDGFKVGYTGIETADLVAQTDGSTAIFFDSAGDDTFESYTDSSTLTTSQISITANGFLQINAWSRAGGNDTATLFDSVDVDSVYSNMRSVTIKQNRGFRRAIQFAQTEVLSLSGNDVASLDLPNGAKTINVSPDQSTVVFGEVTHIFTDLSHTTFSGLANNSDTVFLSGSAGNDILKFLQTETQFYGPSFRYVFRRIPNFETVDETDLGGRDRLVLFDTDGNETLDASGDTVSITGPGYSHNIKFFETIQAYSRNGGVDTATQSSPNGRVFLIGEWK